MKRILVFVIALLIIAGTAYANKMWLCMPKFRGAPTTWAVFRVTDGGGADFVVTDNGGEDYNVK